MGCSHGFVATGWGLDRTGDDNGLAIAAAVPTKNGWSFTVENSGDTAAGGTLYTRCLERKQHAESGQRHSFATRIAKSSGQRRQRHPLLPLQRVQRLNRRLAPRQRRHLPHRHRAGRRPRRSVALR